MATFRSSIAYLLVLLVFGCAVWSILSRGIKNESRATESSAAANANSAVPTGGANPVIAPTSPSGSKTATQSPLALLLRQLAVVISAAALCGALFKKMGQPSVVGEMLAGIILGPSLLGQIMPAWETMLFPATSMGNLNLLSQVGIILFMFSVGMEIDLSSLRKNARVALFVSHLGIVLPFLLGTISALYLFNEYAGAGVRFTSFALFMGIAMSITAFPVLARILEERGLTDSSLGTTALASAAVDDVTAWTLLVLVIAVAKAQSPLSAVSTALLTLAFALVMLFVLRPLAARLLPKAADLGRPSRGVASLVLICVFLSSLATETIGVHSLFGAFLAGAIMPRPGTFRTFLRERLEYSASLFLLPIFFASTGLRTSIGALNQGRDWALFFGLLGLAIAGKFGGGALAARFTGASWRTSVALGALMNTRGLMELIVLNIGLDLGILSPRIFTMLVLMALATTAMTGPVLSLLKVGRHELRQQSDETIGVANPKQQAA